MIEIDAKKVEWDGVDLIFQKKNSKHKYSVIQTLDINSTQKDKLKELIDAFGWAYEFEMTLS